MPQENVTIISADTAIELITGNITGQMNVLSKVPEIKDGETITNEDGTIEFVLVYENTITNEFYSFHYGLFKESETEYRLRLYASPASQVVGMPLVEVVNIPSEVPDTFEELLAEAEEGTDAPSGLDPEIDKPSEN